MDEDAPRESRSAATTARLCCTLFTCASAAATRFSSSCMNAVIAFSK